MFTEGQNVDEPSMLVTCSEAERAQALARFGLIQPFLDGETALSIIARTRRIPLRTLQRWVMRYRQQGLVGLVRKRRSDAGRRRMDTELRHLIEGLARQKHQPNPAAIHRQITDLAAQQDWVIPSYSCAYDIVRRLDPALVMLAHEGSKAYQDAYDLVYRREAGRPNEIWQADHTPLDFYLLNDNEQPIRPWLTVIQTATGFSAAPSVRS